MFTQKNNIRGLLKKIDLKKSIALKALGVGMVKGMREFEARIIKTQISGRPGLIPHSGAAGLHGSFFIKDKGREENKVVTLASRSKYIRIHQFGGVIKAKHSPYLVFRIGSRIYMKKSVTIPKRLHIYEDFRGAGRKLVIQQMLLELKARIRQTGKK